MKQFLFLLAVLGLLAFALVVIARWDSKTWTQPREGLIQGTGANLAFIEVGNERFAILLPGKCVNLTSRGSSNKANQSFLVDTDYFGPGGAPKLSIQYNSDSPYEIEIHGQTFSPAAGKVFFVTTKGDSDEIEEIRQAPFKPLAPSLEYLGKLQKQLKP